MRRKCSCAHPSVTLADAARDLLSRNSITGCKDSRFTLGSERPSATRSTCTIFTLVSHCLHSFALDSRPSPPLQPPVLRMNHTLSRLHSPPPSPFSPFAYYFSFVLRATTINTQPQPHGISTPPIHSLAPFSSILLTFLYNFPIRSAQRRPVYPPLYNTAPSCSRLLRCRDTHCI